LSRQRSGRAAKAAKPTTRGAARAAAPAAAKRPRGVYVQAPRSDVYVVLLGISFGAIALACLFLFLVWNRYELKTKPTASLTPPARSIAADAYASPAPAWT
jgi:hypothetical protein